MQTLMYGPYRISIFPGAGGVIETRGAAPPASRGSRIASLIAVSTPLGRETLVATAVRCLAAGSRVNLHGPCGIGKSTLLRHVALVAGRDLGLPSFYLPVGAEEEPEDLMRRLAQQIQPATHVRFTHEETARILATTRPVVALDPDSWSDDRLRVAMGMLAECRVVVASEEPCLGPAGCSLRLPGLRGEDAMILLERDLGRVVEPDEIAAVRRLITGVQGHPLRLRQAAALMRGGAHSWNDLASAVERHPAALTRMCHGGLSAVDRRLLGTLAAMGGFSLSAGLVDVVSDAGQVQQTLEKLRARRLVEVDGDRFGLPSCRLGHDRDFYLRQLDVGSASRQIVNWLAEQEPSAADTLDLATAVVKLIKIAAERRQWREVVALLEVVEPILTVAGRWESCERLLDLGIRAAHQAGNLHAEGLFHHELGTLKLCEGYEAEARQHLTEALRLRRRIGEHSAAELTQQNLRWLTPVPAAAASPQPASKERPVQRRVFAAAGAVVAVIVLVLGVADVVLGQDETKVTQPPAISASTPATVAPSTPATVAPPTRTPNPPPGTAETSPPGTSPTTTSPGPPLTMTPSLLSFPTREIGPAFLSRGEAHFMKTMTLANNTNRPVIIDAVTSDDRAFRADATDCGMVVGGATCSVRVAFAPFQIGESTGTLTVSPQGFDKVRAKASGIGFTRLTVTLASLSVTGVKDGTGAVNCSGLDPCKVKLDRANQRTVELTAEVCKGCEPVWSGCDETPESRCRLSMTRGRDVKVDAQDPAPVIE
jgi:hypothetical protein